LCREAFETVRVVPASQELDGQARVPISGDNVGKRRNHVLFRGADITLVWRPLVAMLIIGSVDFFFAMSRFRRVIFGSVDQWRASPPHGGKRVMDWLAGNDDGRVERAK